MKRSRPPKLMGLSNHELGELCCAKADALDAGMTLDHPSTRWSLRDLFLEVSARLHKDWPKGEVDD